MSIKTYFEFIKAVIFISLLITIGFFGLQGYKWVNAKLEYQEEQYKIKLEEARKYKVYDSEQAANLARANVQIGSLKGEINRLKAEAESKNQALKEALLDIKRKNERIFNLGQTVASLENNIRKLRTESSHTYKVGTGDPNEQYFIDIMYPVKNKDGTIKKEIPYAWAIFYPNRPKGKKWKYGIYKLDYNIRTIQTEQEDGQINTYTEVWFENNQRKSSQDYKVPIKIVKSEFKQTLVKDTKFYWWAPHINLNIDTGFGSNMNSVVGGGLSVSTSGYGRTKNDLIYRFIDFGLGTNGDDVWCKFSPIAYNIGEFIPLVSNTFIDPFVGYVFNENKTIFGLSLSVPF